MRSVKRTARSLMMVILVCLMLTTTVFAAGNGSVWLNVAQDSSTDGTAAVIASSTAITDGQVELTYDAAVLTYGSTEINDARVALYAVNTDTEGVVKIAWVAAGDYTLEEADWLIQVNFTGLSDEIAMSGTMNTPDGTSPEQAPNLDTTGLKAAVETARGLYQGNYTASSYRAVKQALDNAEAVLADPAATQAEVDAAEEALNNAMDSLVNKVFKDTSDLIKAITRANCLNESDYTEESFAAVEEALDSAKAVLADPKATQQKIDQAAAALNDAIDALELKGETQPTEPKPEKPSQGSSWLGKIKEWVSKWFKPSKPTPTEPTVPETTVPETTEPAEDGSHNSGWGKWFGWIGKWFRWGK